MEDLQSSNDEEKIVRCGQEVKANLGNRFFCLEMKLCSIGRGQRLNEVIHLHYILLISNIVLPVD